MGAMYSLLLKPLKRYRAMTNELYQAIDDLVR